MMPQTAITPTRQENYAQWYQEVIKAADMAENAPVRGCMVIKPWGFRIWELIQQELNGQILATGHENFYFPLFVPLSYLAKEAEHVDGFAKECAVVTHHKLVADKEKGLVPDGPLEEPLVIRPTSEAVIGEAYARWINSYRDLPLLGNQWANVVRWEMRPRIFLRTSEFLWQEGHTAHATKEEAIAETEKMLRVYEALSHNLLAVPVVVGAKTAGEKFPGAETTYAIESMMQDKKALQAGTSHFLGQNFAKAFNIKYLSKEGKEEHVWTTSWGVTTRLIGGLIMTHSDDDGLVLPPRVAPHQVVIIPVLRKGSDEQAIHAYCKRIKQDLEKKSAFKQPVRVHIDFQDRRSGEKVWGWIKKGVPLRLEIGQKEIEEQCVFVGDRTKDPKDKQSEKAVDFIDKIEERLALIQHFLFSRAKTFREKNTHRMNDLEAFQKLFSSQGEGGFALAYWSGDETTEDKLKKDFQVTARCIPLETQAEKGACLFTGQPDAPLVLFAKAY